MFLMILSYIMRRWMIKPVTMQQSTEIFQNTAQKFVNKLLIFLTVREETICPLSHTTLTTAHHWPCPSESTHTSGGLHSIPLPVPLCKRTKIELHVLQLTTQSQQLLVVCFNYWHQHYWYYLTNFYENLQNSILYVTKTPTW